jgi:hypothetical protein
MKSKKFAYRNKHNGKWLKLYLGVYADRYYEVEGIKEVENIADASLYNTKKLFEHDFNSVRGFVLEDATETKREDYELVEIEITYIVKNITE